MGEGSGREIEMAVRLCTPPATSGILPVTYAELPKRCVSWLTWIAQHAPQRRNCVTPW